jgi:hypothetical protein
MDGGRRVPRRLHLSRSRGALQDRLVAVEELDHTSVWADVEVIFDIDLLLAFGLGQPPVTNTGLGRYPARR